MEQDERRLKHSFNALLRSRRLQADTYREKMKRLSPQMRLNEKRQKSAAIEERLHTLMDKKVQRDKHRIAPAEERLNTLIDKKLQHDKHRFAILLERFKARSPLDRLGGGYAYVSNEQGRAVSSAAELNKGEKLKLRLKDGSAGVIIEEVSMNGGDINDG
jgi:exodeoxyribonuclease VII large subunit